MTRAGRDRAHRAPAAVRAVAGALVVLGVASACGAGPAGSAAVQAAVVATGADCLAPEVLADLGLRLDPGLAERASHPAAPAAGRVPDDFVTTGALVCQVGGRMKDGDGTWTAVTATTREGSATDLDALVVALDGGGGSAAADTSCEDDGAPLVVWLVDAMDRAVRPAVPLDPCGAPTAPVRDALDRLPATGQVDHPVELLVPSPPASPSP